MHNFRVKWGIFEEKMRDVQLNAAFSKKKMHDIRVKWGISVKEMSDFGLNGQFSNRKRDTSGLSCQFIKRKWMIFS